VTRVLVVLGYSDRRRRGLHPVCAARLERALAEVEADDTVMLSGWSRSDGEHAEAELMRAAWTATCAGVVCDTGARTTAENASAAAALARRLRPSRVVVVTSDWHAARAKALFRAQLRGSSVKLRVVSVEAGPRPPHAFLRELVRWPLVPFQLGRAGWTAPQSASRRTRPRSRRRSPAALGGDGRTASGSARRPSE
jgi:DUF218 domain